VIWGVVVPFYVIIILRDRVRPRATVTVITSNDNRVDYLLAILAFGIPIPFRYSAKAPAIRGPFEETVMPNELLTCGVEGCEHGAGWWYGYRVEPRGKEDE